MVAALPQETVVERVHESCFPLHHWLVMANHVFTLTQQSFKPTLFHIEALNESFL